MSATVSIEIRYKDGSAGARKATADGLEDIGKAAGKSKGELNAFGEMATGALRKVGEFAVSALADAGRAMIGFVGDSLKGAGDYEQSMNLIAAQSDEAASRLDEFKDTAKALGADLELPATSAKTAGDAMLELSKAGLDVDTVLRDAKGTLQLAAAGNLEAGEAAEYAAAAVNIFGKEAVTAAMAADQYAAVAANSAAEVKDVADANKMAASVYSAMQGPVVGATDAFADLNTALALLAQAGIKGSDAGTSLKQSLLQLASPSDKAKGLMQELAQRVGESGDLAYDASGKMRSYKDIIRITAEATADMTQEQRNYYISTIFGADATRTILALVKAGPKAWDDMRASVTRAGAAHDLAAAQMKGMNGAAAGFQSTIETLMLEALEPLLPVLTAGIERASAFAASFSGQIGPAVQGAIDFVSTAVGIIQTGAIPALSGLTTALITYAVVQAMQATPAIIASIPAIAAQTEAFFANAAAVAAAVAPYVLIAAAIAGVVYAYQNFTEKVSTATQELLNSRQWWVDSTKAIEDYGTQTGKSRETLEPYAATIKVLREQIQGEVEDLGKRMAAGMVSDAQYQEEMATINAHREGLIRVTDAYHDQEQALIRQSAATQTGTAKLEEMNQGEQEIEGQTELTAKEFEKLAKQIEKTFQDGAKAVEGYVNTEMGFMADLEQFRADGDAKKLEQQALAYALEQAAQKAHLGQMLSDYTVAQVQMGNIQKDQADKILAAIEQQFGVQKDMSARTFLAMTSDIDKFAASGSSDIGALSSSLGGLMDDAVETKAKMDALAKKYTAELIQNFKDGKIDADELRRALQDIPRRVESEVIVTTVKRERYETGGVSDESPSGGSGKRAGGGPVIQGTPYLVGERGPEMFVPDSSGRIVPNGQTSMGGNTTVLNYYAMGTAAPEEDVRQALRVRDMLFG